MPADARARASTYFRLFRTWSSTSSLLFTTCVRLFLDFSSTFLIFGVSRAQLPLEKVDDFSFFSRGEVLK